MYSDFHIYRQMILVLLLFLTLSCTSYRKVQQIRLKSMSVGLAVPQEEPLEEQENVNFDVVETQLADGPIIMNAIRDTETGEMVATDVISASRVVARFRNVAERLGRVSLSFDVIVPEIMQDSRFRLKIHPFMSIKQDTLALDAVYVTGKQYREAQLRGYQRYNAFIASIITDSTDFLRKGQLEIFLKRNFPQIYAMKSDSSFVTDPMAESVFGVRQKEAVVHYTNQLKYRLNEGRKSRAGKVYRKYIKDPLEDEGIRLDTVLVSSEGDFIYRYVHSFNSLPGLRKVGISLEGSLFEDGECVAKLPYPEDLTYYISSLSTLADTSVKYKMKILERVAFDNTKALIDFAQGSSVVDTLLGDNASELRRIHRCIDDVVERSEYELDSLVITTSCSPEGNYGTNLRLSKARANSVFQEILNYVPDSWRDMIKVRAKPENWELFSVLVANDESLSKTCRAEIKDIIAFAEASPDAAERMLQTRSEYRHLRQKIYPRLRSVGFDFHLHRKGMVRDTVHTKDVDSVYMSGLKALKDLDYKKAVALLRPYRDFNSALAFVSAGYNHSALDVLEGLNDDRAKVNYLKSILYSRLMMKKDALECLNKAIMQDPSLRHRANLDPELSDLIKYL